MKKNSLLSVAIFCLFQLAVNGQLSPVKWKEDINFLFDRFKNAHPSPFYPFGNEKKFEQYRSKLLRELRGLGDEAVIMKIGRFLALYKDGHTVIRPFQRDTSVVRGRYLPFNVMNFSDGIFISAVAEEKDKFMIGQKLVAINEVPISDVLKKFRDVISFENNNAFVPATRIYLTSTLYLKGLGIIDNDQEVQVSLLDEKNNSQQVSLKTMNILPNPHLGVRVITKDIPTPALYQQRTNEPYWMHYLDKEKTLYLAYNMVASRDEWPIRKLVDSLKLLIDTKDVEKFVVDTRTNGGGDLGLSMPLFNTIYNSRINEYGKLFVIIGPSTFSAASFFITKMELNTRAIFIGQPTGAHPNHYGDGRTMTLPHSKIQLNYSSAYWQNTFFGDNRDSNHPDIFVEVSSKDYWKGDDPSLQAAIDFKAPSKVGEDFATVSRYAEKQYSLSPGHFGRIKNDKGKALLLIQEADLENRLFPFLTTHLYPAGENKYNTDIAGLTVMFPQNGANDITIDFQQNKYPLSEISDTNQLVTKKIQQGEVEKASEMILNYHKGQNRKIIPNIVISRLAYSLIKQKRFQEAVQLYDLNIALFPTMYNHYLSKGSVLEEDLGDIPGAIQAYEKAYSINQMDTRLAEKIKALKEKVK